MSMSNRYFSCSSTWCMGALPVRSPMPLTDVVNTSAPLPSATTVFQAPMPRSLWKCTTSGASGAAALIFGMYSRTA